MKQLMVTLLFAGGLLSLIILLDFLSGTEPSNLVAKAINPFRVMEPAEYIIIFLFVIFILISSVKDYLKKKRKNQSPTN